MAEQNSKHPGLISSVEAGRLFGYTNDYIARLAREKKIIGSQHGRQWYVDPQSVELFIKKAEEAKRQQAEKVSKERRQEREVFIGNVQVSTVSIPRKMVPPTRASALARAGLVLAAGVLVGAVVFNTTQHSPSREALSAGVFSALRAFATELYGMGGGKRVEEEPQVPPAEPLKGPLSHGVEGMIVTPVEAAASGTVAQSFSDDVTVTYDEVGSGGVITPHFKSGDGEGYRFLMVPLNVP
jgi:hypothetical protein